MGKGFVTAFSEYQPHGESLTFTRTFEADVEHSEVLFADALRVREHLAGVVRPSGFGLSFTCAIEGTFINVNDPEPSAQYWEVLQGDTPSSTDNPRLDDVERLPVMTDSALISTYRRALDTITCPPGYFVMFESIAPLGVATRLTETVGSSNPGVLPISFWDETVNLSTATDTTGATWLEPLPEKLPYLPPVDFRIWFDSILVLTLDVNWSRWLQAGTGEHTRLQSALDSLIADDWKPPAGGARHFAV